MLYNSDQGFAVVENYAFQTSIITVLGDRAEQQDSLGYFLKENEGIVVVCDGMGGHKGGKMASKLAVQNFVSSYSGNVSYPDYINMLIETSKITDRMISELTDERGKVLNAGSTVVSVIVANKTLIWCSVGDSRAYLVRNDEMVQLTQDHNYRTVLLEKYRVGLLSKEEFNVEIARGEALISFLGIGNLGLIDYSKAPLELEKDDKIIIMSDGLYKLLDDDEIARIIMNFNNLGEAVQALEMKARKNAKHKKELRDNITMALIKIK